MRLLQINTQRGAAQDRINREQTGAAQRLEIVNNLTPENVDIAWGASPTLNDGAPITTPDGSVEVGNNRTMAIRDMYASHPDKAAIYDKWARSEAERLGVKVDVAAGEPLALVRVTASDRGGLSQEELVKASNTAGTEQRSVAETALSDRRLFSDPTLTAALDPNEDGSFNREFLTAFYNGAGAPKELRFEDGSPDDGKIERRAQAALLAHLLGEQPGVDRVLSSLMDNINTPGVRQVVSGLAKAGPALVGADSINPALSIAPNLGRALTTLLDYRRAKQAGEVRTVEDYFSQGQLLPTGTGKLDPLDSKILNLLASAKSVKQVSEPLLRYAKAVEDYGNPNQHRLFGGDEPPDASAILAAQKTNDERESLWSIAEKESNGPSDAEQHDQKHWARVYRKLFELEKSGKTLTPDQRRIFDQAEAALGQKLLFGDETRGQQSLAQFKAKWSEGPIQGGAVQSQEGLFDTRGAVGRIPEGEEQGTLFAQRTREIPGQLNLFDRLSEPEKQQAVVMAEKVGQQGSVPQLPLGDVETASPTEASKNRASAQIRDFGEKIGGARKDLAEKTGPKGDGKPADDRPGWLKKYHVFEDANKPGVWAVGLSDGGIATRETFSSEEEAE
ncbi:MAG: hypothetical protein M3N12_05785, partial [Verrucomicrobiota bacterium]|nr:hypothetical protein [Verrucomicrobiota bacterium]